MYLWRAVDDEGEVLDVVVQKRRDHDGLTLLKRLLRNQPVEHQAIVTDGLTSYRSALRELKLDHLHRPGRLRENNRAETRTCRSDDESGRCSSSKARRQPSVSSPLMRGSTTPCTPSDT